MITSNLSDPVDHHPSVELQAKGTPRNNDHFDVIIVGAGPAGMSAAVCCARADLNVLIIEKTLPGGECSTAYKINNFIGYPGGILGDKLGHLMEKQLFEYDVAYCCEDVSDIVISGPNVKTVKTSLGNNYHSKTIILAQGLEPKKLDKPFAMQFLGRGVSYYAQGDAESYRNKDVVVIGAGNCACYAAEYLVQYVKKLYLINHFDYIKAVSRLKKSIEKHPKIDVMWDSEITQVFGIDRVEKVQITNQSTQQHTWLDVAGIFVYVGRIPAARFLSFDLQVDEKGFIVTDDYMRTNIPGIYAAGDIRSKQIRQIATAVADGMVAAVNVERDYFR